MKLTPFNTETCVNKKPVKAYISISAATGRVKFSTTTCDKIKLKKGDKISFHQDEEEKYDWYLLNKDPKGFELREDPKNNGLIINSTELCRKIAESVGYEGATGQVLIGSEPVKVDDKVYWPLITTALIKFTS